MVDLVLWYLKSKPKIIKSFSNNICTKKNKLNLHDQVVSLIKFESNVIVKLSYILGVFIHTITESWFMVIKVHLSKVLIMSLQC